MRARIAAGLIATTSLLALAGTAHAQAGSGAGQASSTSGTQAGTTTNGQPIGPATTTADVTTGGNGTASDIVVTGSRVVANGNNMPTPVTVISVEQLQTTRPGNLAETLNDLPVFAGSRSQTSNTGTSGAAGAPATSTNALNVINLRNMGLSRTLILFDGHRAPPSTPEGFVDINTIPQELLKRVDVVTGGASAVYGSDAITGVVNFVTDNKFNGVKANAQYGISKYSDAKTYEGGIAAGTGLFGGRAHLEGSFNYRHDDGLDSKYARPWGYEVRTLQGAGTPASPYFQVIGARASNVTFGGKINSGVLLDQQFTASGALIPFVHGSKTGFGGTIPAGQALEIGGDGGYYNQQLRAKLELKQYFGRFDADISDDIHFYVSGAYTDNYSVGTGDWFSNGALTISRDNAFLSTAAKTALTNAGQTTFSMGKIFQTFPRTQLVTDATQLLTTAGLNGTIAGKWKWEVGYVRGRGDFGVQQPYARDQGRLFAALDSVLVNGVATCRAAATNAAYSGCVPLNPFGAGSESAAAINYIIHPVGWHTYLHMDDVAGSIAGSPFDTWAGPLTVALSGEWRNTTEEVVSNSLPSSFANCAGIGTGTGSNLGCTASTAAYSGTVANLPKSGIKVAEGAIEVQAPLLRDTFLAKSLDLNVAYRRTHYNTTAGNSNTWKVGIVWQPADAVTFRVTRSRDFRAPTIDELFRPQALSQTGFFDYISGSPVTTTNINTYNGGNPNLKPEISDTLTAGIVVRPTSNFSISVDAFDIKVKNFIFLVQGNSPPEQQICYSSKGSSAYCGLITRGLGIYDPANPLAASPANAVTAWYQIPINIAQQSTWGADFEVNWRTALFDRPVNLRLLTTWQPTLKFHRDGLVDNDYAGVAFGTNGIQATPEFRITEFIDVKPTDNLTVSFQERYRSSLLFHSDPTVVVDAAPVKAFWQTNVNVAYDLPLGFAKVQAFFNVQNLFNAYPPRAGFWGNPSPGQFGEFVQSDDVIGRYYTFGLRGRF